MPEAVLTSWRCSGCGTETRLPWACPQRVDDDNVDHVLARRMIVERVSFVDTPSESNPFVRFRALSQIYQLARLAGLSDDDYVNLTRDLDAKVAAVDGRGFRSTPLTRLGGDTGIWLKHDWQSVGGSHKARHLMGIALYLTVARRLGARSDIPPLAIASCGNAALAAAIVARAIDAPLTVFIPDDAKAQVVAHLQALHATVVVCPRRPDSPPGDPTYHAFRAAVKQGALPFCVQGPDCGLTIEGGRSLGWEIAAALADTPQSTRPEHVVVQVGGGAMASSIAAGLNDFVAIDRLEKSPAIYAVQTSGCAPLKRAWDAVVAHRGESGSMEASLTAARRNRSQHMWPWDNPHSIAHGILDDETYDWAAVVSAMASSGGHPLLVDEDDLLQAREIASAAAGATVSYTGAAGLAAAMKFKPDDQQRTLVILSGRNRDD